MEATVTIHHRLRRAWIVKLAVQIAGITESFFPAFTYALINGAASCARPEWRIDGERHWRSMGRLRFVRSDDGDYEFFAEKPEVVT